MAKPKLSPQDQVAKDRLNALWRAHKKATGVTQAKAAEALDISEGAVSQYLRGDMPLGIRATHRWAAFLGVDPHEIRPDLDARIGVKRQYVNEKLLEESIIELERILNEWGVEMDPRLKGRLAAAIYSEALETGEINPQVIRGMVRLLAS